MAINFRKFLEDRRRAIGVDRATQTILLGVIVPLWQFAGLADWYCHRRTDIEHTAGAHESATHAAMMTQAGIPATLGLFFEINSGVLATTYAALAAHQATAFWDVRYAEEHREVNDVEQHVHGMLEQVPVMATAFLTALHWDQALALVGRGPAQRDFRLRWKRDPLPPRHIAALLASIGVTVVAPYAEELWRCWRADRTVLPHDADADSGEIGAEHG